MFEIPLTGDPTNLKNRKKTTSMKNKIH